MELGKRRQEVNVWLQELYGSETVPEYELNTKTITQLYELSVLCRQQDHMKRLVSEDLQQKTAEYNAKAQQLGSVLSRMKLDYNNLSQSGVNSTRTLARLGSLLNVKDASESCFFIALQNFDTELRRLSELEREESESLAELMTKSHDALLKCSTLQRNLETIEKSASGEDCLVSKKESDAVFYHGKAKEYKNKVKELQAQLAKSKVNKSLYHEKITNKFEALKSLQEQLVPLRAELQSYATLPPDMAETKIKIEQQKRELAKLEKAIAESIDMTMS